MKFRVGNKVWEAGRGNGEVTSIGDEGDMYPIEVDFDNGDDECYTLDGKRYEKHPYRSLFYGWDLKITGEILPVERWILKYSDNVTSDILFKSEKDAREFSRFNPDATYHKVIV